MKTKGFIKSVNIAFDKNNTPRTWVNPAGETYEFFTARIIIPHTSPNGQVYNDELLADIVRQKVDNQALPYQNYINTEKPLELTIIFSVREQDGKRPWASAKLTNVALLVE